MEARWHHVVVVALVVLAYVGYPVPTYAAQPIFVTIPINDTLSNSSLCGFPLTHHFEGVLKLTVLLNEAGIEERIIRRIEATETILNPATDVSVTRDFRRAHNLILDVTPPVMNPDGSITYHNRVVGLDILSVIPGEGNVNLSAGMRDFYITCASDGTFLRYEAVIFGPGHHDRQKLCELLS